MRVYIVLLVSLLVLSLLGVIVEASDLVRVAPGFLALREPRANRVEAVVHFANSTWFFQAYSLQLPSGRCRGVWGNQSWDLWIVEHYPLDYPPAHVNDNLSMPLRGEFRRGPLAAEKHWVLVLRAGSAYYCRGWRLGGYARLTLELTAPPARNLTVLVTAAQLGGWSSVDQAYYDSVLLVRVESSGGRRSEKILLGGDEEGWITISVSVVHRGGRIRVTLEPIAGGTVRACKLCNGAWDREFIGIDRVEVLVDGRPILVEDFEPRGAVITKPGTSTTTSTATSSTPVHTTVTTSTAIRTTTIATTSIVSTHTTATGAASMPATGAGQGAMRREDIVYTVSVEARGPEGSLSERGTLALSIIEAGGEIRVEPRGSTLSEKARLVLAAVHWITDLARLALGATSVYHEGAAKTMPCPVLGGSNASGTTTYHGLAVRYECRYSQGTLTSLHVEARGPNAYLRIDASLEGQGRAGTPTWMLAGLAAAAAAAATAALLHLRRRH